MQFDLRSWMCEVLLPLSESWSWIDAECGLQLSMMATRLRSGDNPRLSELGRGGALPKR